jgi:hypothetical protein
VTCTIKTVADVDRAAAHAVSINPVNAPLVPRPQELAVLTSKYWGAQDRTLSVSFLDTNDAALRNKILGHMNAWFDQGACIRFAWTAGVGDVRIARDPDGYWSYLGTDINLIPDDEPTMNLEGFTVNTTDALCRRVIRHETGHTLGFPHEHLRGEIIDRIDVAKALEYFKRTQGWDEATVVSNVLEPLELSSIMASALADEQSLMCYWLPGSIMTNGVAVRGGNDISSTDREHAVKVYPKASTVGPDTVGFLAKWWAAIKNLWKRA